MTTPLDSSSLLILVVDDSATNQDIMEALLSRLGCRVHCASSGSEALDALAQSPVDLIFMDFHMPQMDGLQASREIRRREGSERHTPIIGLTAGDAELSNRQCLEAGMNDVLIKPASGAQLKAALLQWAAPVDKGLLDDLRQELGGEGSLPYEQAIDSFLQEGARHVSALVEAANHGKPDVVKEEAHLLKGTSGYFGARSMQLLSHKIESCAFGADATVVRQYACTLEKEFERVRKVLQEEKSIGSR